MKKTALLIALFLAAPVAPQAAMAPQSSADTVLPGYWEYTTSAVGVRDTETKCVRPSEINRFFGGLSTNKWRCTYPTRVVGNGNARFEGTCQDRKGRRIEFFGVGNSGVVAQDAQHKFFRLGVHTVAHSDGHMQVMSASLLGPGDCVVVISNSGRTRDLMDATDIARKHGATTIVITASGSPLASAGHIHLTADHPEGYDKYSPMVSRLLHLLIIDILATTVALRIGEELQPVLRDMKKNLSSKRYT